MSSVASPAYNAYSSVVAGTCNCITNRLMAQGLRACGGQWRLSRSVADVLFTPTDNKQRIKQNPEGYTAHLAALSLPGHLQMYPSLSWLQRCLAVLAIRLQHYISYTDRARTGVMQTYCHVQAKEPTNQPTNHVWSGPCDTITSATYIPSLPV